MFTVGKFIVMKRGSRIFDYVSENPGRNSKSVNVEYSLPGQVVFNINETVPVILEGSGCIGLASPTKFLVTEHKTTVLFKYYERKTNDPVAEALYKYYQMQGNVSESSGGSTSGGGFILPGLDPNANRGGNNSGKKSTKKDYGDYEDDFDPFSGPDYKGF